MIRQAVSDQTWARQLFYFKADVATVFLVNKACPALIAKIL